MVVAWPGSTPATPSSTHGAASEGAATSASEVDVEARARSSSSCCGERAVEDRRDDRRRPRRGGARAARAAAAARRSARRGRRRRGRASSSASRDGGVVGLLAAAHLGAAAPRAPAPTSSNRSPRPASRTRRRCGLGHGRSVPGVAFAPVSSHEPAGACRPSTRSPRALDAPRAVALAVARAVVEERRAELLGRRRRRRRPRRARARRRPRRRAVAAAGGQRDRRDRPHQPRPRAAARPPRARRSRAPPRATRTSSSTSERGERGSRHAHVEALLRELTGAEAALAVNNCAGAVLLAAAALAGPGREWSSRAGSSSRSAAASASPRSSRRSGARLVEVGTTNRTRRADYERALTATRTGAILRAHPSNFRTVGFVEEVAIEALCELGVPVIDDVGSGVLADDSRRWPTSRRCAARSRAGAALVCFCGDKLLGGPQAGLLVGRATRSRAARATRWRARCGSTSSRSPRWRRRCGCTATRERARREIPVLAMLDAREDELRARAPSGWRRRSAAPRSSRAIARGRRRGAAAARARGPGGGARSGDARRAGRARCAPPTRRWSARIEDGPRAARPAHDGRRGGRGSAARGRGRADGARPTPRR